MSPMAPEENGQEPFIPLLPKDEHNSLLESHVHPADWKNPTPIKPYDLVVIGAGTAGLVTAAGAAGLGARVALIERELMGGDCLNVGCVPSKGIIRAARVAATVRDAQPFGIQIPEGTTIDFAQVMTRMRRLRAQISPNDSTQRFTDLGVDVFLGQGTFVDINTISVTEKDGSKQELQYKKAVLATGARASAPPIPGLDQVPYLTNENLFSLTELPKRFAIVGAGPIGCEMAQTFARLGSQVTLYGKGGVLLPRDDQDAGSIIVRQFEKDGITMILDSKEMQVTQSESGEIHITTAANGKTQEVIADQILIAVGRAPNTEGLNLEGVQVLYDQRGVQVNDHLQTTNPRIFAAGDLCSPYKFTHAADFQARIVIQNALFAIGPFGKRKASQLIIPWATYTSPEVAHVGLLPKEAKEMGIEIDTYTQHLADVDRAILEGQDEGFVKVHTKKGSDKILGATIVAENAGDMISELTVAMNGGLGLSQIGASIHPYPTQAEAIRKLGDQFNRTKLTSFSKMVLNLLRKLNLGT